MTDRTSAHAPHWRVDMRKLEHICVSLIARATRTERRRTPRRHSVTGEHAENEVVSMTVAIESAERPRPVGAGPCSAVLCRVASGFLQL